MKSYQITPQLMREIKSVVKKGVCAYAKHPGCNYTHRVYDARTKGGIPQIWILWTDHSNPFAIVSGMKWMAVTEFEDVWTL